MHCLFRQASSTIIGLIPFACSCVHSLCSLRRSRHRDYKSVQVEPEPQICDGLTLKRSNNGTGAGGGRPKKSILTSRCGPESL